MADGLQNYLFKMVQLNPKKVLHMKRFGDAQKKIRLLNFLFPNNFCGNYRNISLH